jgi:ABC-type Fe3+-siderophore transport system permease subunit
MLLHVALALTTLLLQSVTELQMDKPTLLSETHGAQHGVTKASFKLHKVPQVQPQEFALSTLMFTIQTQSMPDQI